MSFIRIEQYRQAARSPLAILRQTWRLQTGHNFSGITVVSAFTDSEIIGQLLDELDTEAGPKKIVRILLDYGASGYHRDKNLTNNLNLLSKRLSKDFHKNSGIFLINLGRLLHSKLFLLHSKNGDKVSVGSLNFTRRAFLVNEEILTTIGNSRQILVIINYINELLASKGCRKVPFKRPPDSGSYREWLLNGVLFYEDRVTSPFNFKLGLPPELLKQPASIIPGAQAEVPDNISLLQLLGIPRTKLALAWKKYCIPTCYNFWCPRQLTEIARDSIKKSITEKSRAKIEPILRNKDTLTNEFHPLFDEIAINIINFNKTNKTNYKWDKQKANDRLDKWAPRIVAKLQNENNLFRLLAGANETIVPDFWAGDEIALREFEESFCSHIVLELSKSRVQNWVALWLRDDLRLAANWGDSWQDEELWLQWLHDQVTDPFKELPKTWEL